MKPGKLWLASLSAISFNSIPEKHALLHLIRVLIS